MYDLTYERATGPSNGAQPGTVLLQNHILDMWPAAWSKGIFNPRVIRGTENKTPPRWSIHAEGRAVDIGVSMQPAGEVIGDEIADWLTVHAANLGIQYFIWNRQSWSHSRGWTAFRGGSGAHRDHLHIEQTRLAAATLSEIPVDEVIPVGPYGRTSPDYDPPRQLRPKVSETNCPGGGIWELADNGDVYAKGCRYHGGPNNELRAITYDVLGVPTQIRAIDADGDVDRGYRIVTDLGYGYEYFLGT